MTSTSVSPSSSLGNLAQHNRSRSTVSTSDTDGDSMEYISSSGTTTPEDEAQTFHLSSTLQSALAEKPRRLPSEKLVTRLKHRNLSSAMRKMKRVANTLVVFKKKKSEDNCPNLISSPSPLRERFGKRMSVKPRPEETFYSLPNRRFSLSDVSTPPSQRQLETMITRKFGTVSGSTSSFTKEGFRKYRSLPDFSDSRRDSTLQLSTPPALANAPSEQGLKLNSLLVHVFRILLFVPWCIAVGGTLLLFPGYVECVAFGPAYIPSPDGIRRFAHWAECGQQHVMTFLGCIAIVVWYNYALGLSLVTIVVSRFVYVWHDFKLDKSIPLGGDDQQSLYLVVMGLASADGVFRMSGPGKERAEEITTSA